jgi:hypothetical protein
MPASGAVQQIQGGVVTPLAEGQDDPIALAAFSDQLLWINRGVLRGVGALMQSGPSGIQTVRGGLDYPTALARDGDQVYVSVTGAEDEVKEGRIVRIALGTPDLVDFAKAQQLPRGIAVDAHLVYWVDYGTSSSTDGTVIANFK